MTETTIKKHIPFEKPISPDTAQGGFGFIPNGIREKNIFFYHPDHLGSSSYITGQDGKVSQHTEYIAFGEILFDEHSSEHTMPYLFNGKELDSETGLYYYGARYYDPKVSIFVNVDPLVEKTMQPYAYANNNPVRFIDPTGMEGKEPPIKGIDFFSDNTGNYFWNLSKNQYEHYQKGKDGRTYFKGFYTPTEKKGPVGNYSIIHNKKELAIRDYVEETFYTDTFKEEISHPITLEYSSRDIKKSEVFVRDKNTKDKITLIESINQPRTMTDHISGISIKVNKYVETRGYNTLPRQKAMPSPTSNAMENIAVDILSTFIEKTIKKK